MKNKKLLIAIGIIVVLLIVGIVFFLNRKDTPSKPNDVEYTITYNTDGGNSIDSVKVKSGSKVILPKENPVKEDYNFIGWFIEEESISADYVVEKDITLTAKWEGKEVCIITFDSNGGDKVKDLTFEEGKEIKLPVPKRKGYKFVVWEDKNGMPILSGARLECGSVKLTAKWEKSEQEKQAKQYTCPDGYKLSGTKCTIEGKVTKSCPEKTYEYNGKCVNFSSKGSETRTCGKKNVIVDNNGHTAYAQGVLLYAGTTFCYYYKLDESESECSSRGHAWHRDSSTCYVSSDSEYTTTCNDTKNYTYIKKPDSINPNAHIGGGCFKITSMNYSCEDGYTVTNEKCIKTIDATLK